MVVIDDSVPFYKQFIAGAGAGITEVCLMYPTDVVKTRFQLAKGQEKRSVIGTFQNIIQNEGFMRLYRGIASPIFAEAPKRAIKFACNAKYQNMLRDENGKLSHSRAGIAGALAGATEAFANTPFEVVKVRSQSVEGLSLYNGTLDCASKIMKTEGPLAFYKGFEAQLLRNMIWNGTYFGVINIVKGNLWTPTDKKSEMFRNFIAGVIGGTLATTANTPIDVVKSRMQNVGSTVGWTLPNLVALIREEGIQGCYRGYVPRLLRLGPGGGIMLLAFDFILGLLK